MRTGTRIAEASFITGVVDLKFVIQWIEGDKRISNPKTTPGS